MNITDYTRILPIGKENAIATEELAKRLGFESARALQVDIAKSRNAGQVILSSTTGGYYLPQNDAEIEEFVEVLRARAINTFRAIQSAKQFLEQTYKRLSTTNLVDIIKREPF